MKDLWLNEKEVIMPLSATKNEIDGIPAAIRDTVSNLTQIRTLGFELEGIKKIILIGSGESYIVAKMAQVSANLYSGITVEAVQSYDFAVYEEYQVGGSDTLVIAITSSGRYSQVIVALEKAVINGFKTIALVNDAAKWSRPIRPEHIISTLASKQGMPTQSTVCSFIALLNLISFLDNTNGLAKEFVLELVDTPKIIKRVLSRTEAFFNEELIDVMIHATRWTCLGTGYSSHIAETMANLLACGPMIEANAMPTEEYHHSLRMFLPQRGKLFFIFDENAHATELTLSTIKDLLNAGAKVLLIHQYKIDETFLDSNDFISFNYRAEVSFSKEHTSIELMSIAQMIAFLMAKKAVANGLVRAQI
ncbi:SIS domain-containing protein [Vibrio europaeus]|uniref:Glutamine--fructose-6-phosphate aminotransferase [isomerizing] n=1 Tax=Vibrio europaeus TaxID=300876 RepID=A0A178J614_9VIBR|nr:SIS domain-containing protein [Vibrio europaeus]MDC5706184.1 SIS domain-containing protein [Vibrio europaeus]MDC5709594.1 SIS domain-containing protein [Vibrio europaeus]MDC5713993.1 SIS domain-containing protein [Vibrio europaeus]MDC5723398.1 SIS domain-containing protein [Vibrio europaeus]MDC5730130.1 SIS domain-containing protein [Vibrio europaeus]